VTAALQQEAIAAAGAEVALAIQDLSKTFPGGKALDGVTFDVRRGAVHGLLGGNGSGKSTLVKSLAGVQGADPGGMVNVGESSVGSDAVTPTWARAAGLRFVHQNPGVFPDLTVEENIAIGDAMPSTVGWLRRDVMRRRAARLLEHFGINAAPTDKVGDLRLADQTMVAIARAMQDHLEGREALSALVLDEPTASLPREEVTVLLDAVRAVAASGVAVIYISHRLDEVLDICSDITVLRDGQHVLTQTTEGLTDRELVAAIVGRPLEKVFPPAREPADTRAAVLELDKVSGHGVDAVSLQVYPGEILGIAGLLGSGRSELLQLVFGLNPCTGGEIRFDGSTVHVQGVRQAMDLGIAYVPEHRDTEGAFAELSVRQNLAAADIASFSRRGRLDHGEERRAAQDAISRYGIKASGEGALMSSLSGGNQQKVILARWMRRNPRLLLLDEPTQGVDVGARADAYRIIREATAQGVAAILVSSDFEELADMSDRVLILSNGRIAGEVDGHGLDRHTLTELVFTAKEIHP